MSKRNSITVPDFMTTTPIPELKNPTPAEIIELDAFWSEFGKLLPAWIITQKQTDREMHQHNTTRDYGIPVNNRSNAWISGKIASPVLFRQPMVLKTMIGLSHFTFELSDVLIELVKRNGFKSYAFIIACESNHFHCHLFGHNDVKHEGRIIPILWEINDKRPDVTEIVDSALRGAGLVGMAVNWAKS